MYTYKNTVTGVTIKTYGKIKGGNWVQVKDTKTKAANASKDDEKEPAGE